MVAIRIEVTGIKEIEDQLNNRLPKESKAILRRTMVRLARDVRDDARIRARQRTRTLRKAIVHKRDRGRKGSIEASVWVRHGRAVKHSAFYWRFIEWGTSHHSATPFLTPAFERGRANFRKFFRTEFFRQLARQIKKRGPSA